MCDFTNSRGCLLSFLSHSLLTYECARYPDRHVYNREKGFDVFLQAAGKVPLS